MKGLLQTFVVTPYRQNRQMRSRLNVRRLMPVFTGLEARLGLARIDHQLGHQIFYTVWRKIKVSVFKKVQKALTAMVLVLVLSVVTACSGATPTAQQPNLISPSVTSSQNYAQLERGNTTTGENFGNWVVQNAKGLIQDAYVRDNDKLGVVITPQVRPNEVRDLARSLTQGFHNSFPGRNLKVLVYAPDKQLILTADYDVQSQQIQYKAG